MGVEERVTLLHGDVRRPLAAATVISGRSPPPTFDLICAFNFSVLLMHTRADLLQYLSNVRAAMAPHSVLAFDFFGGPDSHRRLKYRRYFNDFVVSNF
jgi:hypothetical protein